jgi:FMN-dependent NADH-azoreductase
MTTLLQINASIHSNGGSSSQLASQFVQAFQAHHPQTRVVQRDLATDVVPHLTAERFGAFLRQPEQRSDAERAVVEYSDALIDELRSADVIVIGLPMYNFGVPSQLKAYFDHIARAGSTFTYTAQGAVGLLTGKRAYVFATRGGRYVGTPLDTQTSYLRDFLRFVGIEQVEFVYAEGLHMSPGSKSESLALAASQIEKLNAAPIEQAVAA